MELWGERVLPFSHLCAFSLWTRCVVVSLSCGVRDHPSLHQTESVITHTIHTLTLWGAATRNG